MSKRVCNGRASIDDTSIEAQFEDGDGNAYKPEEAGAIFAEGTFSEDAFEKQANRKEKPAGMYRC